MSLAVPIIELVTADRPYVWRTLVAGDLGQPSSSDGSKIRMIRHVGLGFFEEFISDQAQLEDFNLWLGEAVANAFEHASRGGHVSMILRRGSSCSVFEIANSSDGYRGSDPISDPYSEKGRGRKNMEAMVADLRKLGLRIEDDCKFIPDGDNGSGQTIVSLSLGLKGGVEVA